MFDCICGYMVLYGVLVLLVGIGCRNPKGKEYRQEITPCIGQGVLCGHGLPMVKASNI